MKNLRTAALCVSAMLYSLCLTAQNEKPPITEPDYNKPKLFNNLPEKIPVTVDEINNLLNTAIGETISLKLSITSSIQFDGKVIYAASKYGNSIRSVVIRSSNYNGASFTISKIISAGKVVSYAGRIMSFAHGDLYELQKLDGQLVLVKRNYYELVNE